MACVPSFLQFFQNPDKNENLGGATRPEELMISYLKLRTATRNIANGLGVLALLWSTVVLLGGFVSVLRVKEFWVVTGLSFLTACRMLDVVDEEVAGDILVGREGWGFDVVRRSTYLEEGRIIGILGQLKRIVGTKGWGNFKLRIPFIMVLVVKVLSLGPLIPILYLPFVSLGVSVWRLVHRDYGDAGGDAANRAKLAAALDIFYALVLYQSLFAIYWVHLLAVSDTSVYEVSSLVNKQRGYEKWIIKVVEMYYKETRRKYTKDRELPVNWNLITYAVGLLQSTSGDDDDHLWGARLLDKLICDNKDIVYVRQKLLSSRISVQNLIGMIGRRGTADNTENRERAARILAHLASDLNIAHFPGTLQCICSLLESSCNQFCEPQVTCQFCEPQVTCPSLEKNPDEQSRSLETSNHQHDAHMLVPIQEQTDNEQEQADAPSSSVGLAQRKQDFFLSRFRQHEKDIMELRRYTYRSRGAKELVSQGLLILERLTQDQGNCREIRGHQRLLSKITSPLRSQGFPSNVRDKTMVGIQSRLLTTVVSRLLTSPRDGPTRLRQELASTTEAVSNLMAILETSSKGAKKLHQQALEILTELAFDDSFKKLDFNKLFKALLSIFLMEAPSNDTEVHVEEADRDRATRLIKGKAGEALARLLHIRMARDASAVDILSRQDAIHLLTKVLNQILSSKMGTTTDAVENAVKRSATEMGALMTNVFNGKMGGNVHAKAVTKTQKQVAEEVINQILCSEVGTIADAARKAFTRNENIPAKVLDEILSRKMETTVVGILQPVIQGIKKQSDERKFLAAILSVAVVICNENVISKEDFARAIPEDAALVEKLTEILKLNKRSTAECLRVVKLTCQVVIAMIQVKPSCIADFNEHNFKEELTEALETMSEVDECLLFAGNDRDEVIKPARSLVSLVKETHELLNTEHKNIDISA